MVWDRSGIWDAAHLPTQPSKPTVFLPHSKYLFSIYYLPHTALWTIDSTLNKILSLSLKGSHSSRGEIKVIIMILSDKCLKHVLWACGEGTISCLERVAPRGKLQIRFERWRGLGGLAIHQMEKIGSSGRGRSVRSRNRKAESKYVTSLGGSGLWTLCKRPEENGGCCHLIVGPL